MTEEKNSMNIEDILGAIKLSLIALGDRGVVLELVTQYGKAMQRIVIDDPEKFGILISEGELSDDEIEERGIQAAVERREAMYDQG